MMKFRHSLLLQQFTKAGGTLEDLARAWASIDGKLDKFDAEKHMSVRDVEDGAYHGYLTETEEAFERATKYALERK